VTPGRSNAGWSALVLGGACLVGCSALPIIVPDLRNPAGHLSRPLDQLSDWKPLKVVLRIVIRFGAKTFFIVSKRH